MQNITTFQKTFKIHSFVRELPGINSILVVINLSPSSVTNVKGSLLTTLLPSDGTVRLISDTPGESQGSNINMNAINLKGNQAMVIEFEPESLFTENSQKCYVSDPVRRNKIGILQKA